MASFTDQIMTFSPYISQQPVDDYIRVGMEKQRQYDEGVTRVQSYLDSIAGIDIIKGEHKNYLGQRVNQLTTQISGVLSEDFSNKALIGQIGNLATHVVKDPIIQNAVVSTQKYRAELGKMEKARSEGKNSPSNDWLWQTQTQAWLSDGDAKSAYNAEYVPYRDVRKKVMDAIKQLSPSSRLSQLPFLMGDDGQISMDENGKPEINVAMIERSVEGIDINHVRAAIQGALDEGDIQQLQIDGMYHFRGETPQTLKTTLDKNYQSRLDDVQQRRQLIQLKRRERTNDKAYQALVDQEAASIENEAEKLIIDYQEDFNSLNENPEGFKSKFYITNFVNTLSSAYSTLKESQKYLDSPFRAAYEFDLNYQLAREKMEADWEIELRKLDAAKEKKEKERKPLTADGQLKGALITDVVKPTEALFLEDLDKSEKELIGLENQILSREFPGKSPQEAKASLLKAKEEWEKGTSIDAGLAEYFELTSELQKDVDDRKAIISRVRAEADANPNFKIQAENGVPLKLGNNTYTPEEIAQFHIKFFGQLTSSAGGATKIDEKKAEQILTPKEKELYKIRKKQIESGNTATLSGLFGGSSLTKEEQAALDVMTTNYKKVVRPSRDNLGARASFTSERLAQLTSEYQPKIGGYDTSTPEARKQVESDINKFLTLAETMGGSLGESPNFDLEVARKILSKPETEFANITQGGKAYIQMSSPGEETQFIPATREQYEGVFGESLWSKYQFVEDAISRTGGLSTNVQKPKNYVDGWKTARFDRGFFKNITNSGVKADLEPTMKGNYKIVFYIFDPQSNQWVNRNYPTPAKSIPQALETFGAMTDEDVQNLINATAR